MCGSTHPSYKGGKMIANGYIFILNREHPHNNDGYVQEHRLVSEKCLGRYLTAKEVIHHINEVRDDNHQENLYLFNSEIDHRTFHHKKVKVQLISNLSRLSL